MAAEPVRHLLFLGRMPSRRARITPKKKDGRSRGRPHGTRTPCSGYCWKVGNPHNALSILAVCVQSRNPVEGGAFPGNRLLFGLRETENKKTFPRDRGKVQERLFPFPARAGLLGYRKSSGLLASASAYSPRLPGSGLPVAYSRISSAVTAAGQRRTHTVFPLRFRYILSSNKNHG